MFTMSRDLWYIKLMLLVLGWYQYTNEILPHPIEFVWFLLPMEYLKKYFRFYFWRSGFCIINVLKLQKAKFFS